MSNEMNQNDSWEIEFQDPIQSWAPEEAAEDAPANEMPPIPEMPQYSPPPKKERKPLTGGKLVALALCCSLLGGVIGGIGVNLATGKKGPHTTTITQGDRENTVIEIVTRETGTLMTPAEVYAANVNSTVGITTQVTTNLWGFQTTSAASGSGFILTEDGYILTNHHVIEDASAIHVSFFDGQSAPATLIGYDASNDIAVLKVDATGLTPVTLGDSANMNVGDDVVAIGNPLGELTFSLTTGAISALEREVTVSSGVTMRLLQTDCAINSGNSGGALFNLYGEVIGITNAKYSSNSTSEAPIDNIGFAIPVNNIMEIVESIIEKGYVAKPYIGISVSDVSEESQSYGLPKGAAVKQVVSGSPAETAGLLVNDIITHANGEAVSGSNHLVSIVGALNVGDSLKLTVYRQGTTVELEIIVGETIQSATGSDTQQSGNSSGGYSGNFEFPWNFGY